MHELIDTLAPTNDGLNEVVSASQGLTDTFQNATLGLLNMFVVRPLARLYLDGPSVLGMWAGRPLPDICAQLTNTDAAFWHSSDRNILECEAHVERHFNSYMVLVSTAGYFCVTFGCVYAILCRRGRHHAPPQVIYLQNNSPAPKK